MSIAKCSKNYKLRYKFRQRFRSTCPHWRLWPWLFYQFNVSIQSGATRETQALQGPEDRLLRWRSTRRLSTSRLQIILFPITRTARVRECITGIIDRKGTCACALRSFGQFPQISPHFGLLELGNYKPGLSVLPCNYAGPGRNCRSWILLLWCTELMPASGLPCSHYWVIDPNLSAEMLFWCTYPKIKSGT